MTHKFVIELVDDCKGYKQDVDYLERIYGAEPIKEHDEEIYNKALDDFLTEICKMIVQSENNGDYRFYAVEIKQSIADLAEQLKEKYNE